MVNRYIQLITASLGLLLAACAGGTGPTVTTQPEATATGGVALEATAQSGVVYPEDPSQAGLAPYPDEPVDAIPTQPVPVTYVVEHRTALDGQEVVVQGTVVGTLLGEKACPPDRGMCAQPSVFLADSADPDRNSLYDLRVLVGESEVETDYPLGEVVDIRVIVSGTNVGIVATKVY